MPNPIPVHRSRRPLAALAFAVAVAFSAPAGAAEPFAGIKPGMAGDAAVATLQAVNPAFAYSGTYVDLRAGRAVAPGPLTLIACDGVANGPRCDPPATDRNYERIVLGISAGAGRVIFVSHVWFPASGREPAFAGFRDQTLQQFPGAMQIVGQQYGRSTDAFGKPDVRCLRVEPHVVPQSADPDCGTSLSLAFFPVTGGTALSKFVGVQLDHQTGSAAAMAGQSARDAARDLEQIQRGRARTRSL